METHSPSCKTICFMGISNVLPPLKCQCGAVWPMVGSGPERHRQRKTALSEAARSVDLCRLKIKSYLCILNSLWQWLALGRTMTGLNFCLNWAKLTTKSPYKYHCYFGQHSEGEDQLRRGSAMMRGKLRGTPGFGRRTAWATTILEASRKSTFVEMLLVTITRYFLLTLTVVLTTWRPSLGRLR